MTRNITLAVLILSISALSCSPTETSTETVQTATISPATVPTSDTDVQMPTTQTTEIGEDRSPNEGGLPGEEGAVSVSPSPAVSPQ